MTGFSERNVSEHAHGSADEHCLEARKGKASGSKDVVREVGVSTRFTLESKYGGMLSQAHEAKQFRDAWWFDFEDSANGSNY